MICCKICGKEFKKCIGKHLNFTHHMTLEEYYVRYIDK